MDECKPLDGGGGGSGDGKTPPFFLPIYGENVILLGRVGAHALAKELGVGAR